MVQPSSAMSKSQEVLPQVAGQSDAKNVVNGAEFPSSTSMPNLQGASASGNPSVPLCIISTCLIVTQQCYSIRC